MHDKNADVLSTRRFAMKAAPCGVSMEEVDPDARGFVYYLCSDIDPAVAALLARNAEMEAERDGALRRANRANARVKGWEATMVVANLPRRICPVDGGRPGEGETVEIPALTPERLTEILDRVDALAAENKALREAMETICSTNQVREFMGDDAADGYGNQGFVTRDGQYAKIARAALARTPAKENDDG